MRHTLGEIWGKARVHRGHRRTPADPTSSQLKGPSDPSGPSKSPPVGRPQSPVKVQVLSPAPRFFRPSGAFFLASPATSVGAAGQKWGESGAIGPELCGVARAPPLGMRLLGNLASVATQYPPSQGPGAVRYPGFWVAVWDGYPEAGIADRFRTHGPAFLRFGGAIARVWLCLLGVLPYTGSVLREELLRAAGSVLR